MLALDDAQFADRSSLQCLVYLAARCQELPVLLALTIRNDESSAADELLSALRDRCRHDDHLAGAAQPGRGRAARARPSRRACRAAEFCDACARATRRQPVSARRAADRSGRSRAARVGANAARGRAQASPESVRRVVLGRLDRLGADAVALAQAVAVLEHASVREAGELARMDPEAAVAGADRSARRRGSSRPSR